jgi:hypothetical protein
VLRQIQVFLDNEKFKNLIYSALIVSEFPTRASLKGAGLPKKGKPITTIKPLGGKLCVMLASPTLTFTVRVAIPLVQVQ